MIPILSTAYFPPVGYFVLLANHPAVLIDPCENYHKQSFRNRCEIYSPNGKQALSINIQKESGVKTQIRDICIDYSFEWVENHLKSLEAAYSSSPFYEFYIDEIQDILKSRPAGLFDLNQQLLKHLLTCIGLDTRILVAEAYQQPENPAIDYRAAFHPKPQFAQRQRLLHLPDYYQVFNLKFGYLSNLSILDLLFNIGTESEIYLKRKAAFLTSIG